MNTEIEINRPFTCEQIETIVGGLELEPLDVESYDGFVKNMMGIFVPNEKFSVYNKSVREEDWTRIDASPLYSKGSRDAGSSFDVCYRVIMESGMRFYFDRNHDLKFSLDPGKALYVERPRDELGVDKELYLRIEKLSTE
jgi:hypothetical protein